MTQPAKAAGGEAVPDPLSIEVVLQRFDGDARAALESALADIAYLRNEIQLASLAMSFGFARGWHPRIERLPNDR